MLELTLFLLLNCKEPIACTVEVDKDVPDKVWISANAQPTLMCILVNTADMVCLFAEKP
jgi:hypothetical protein